MKARKWEIVADTIIGGVRAEKHIEFFTGTYKELLKRASELDEEHWKSKESDAIYEAVEAYLLEDGERVNDWKKIARMAKN